MSYRTIEQVQSVVVKFVTQKTLEEITAQLKRLVPESRTYWPNMDSCRVGDWIKKLEYSFKQIESVVMPHVDPKYHTSIIQQLIWLDGSFLKAEDQTKVQADLEQLKKKWREAEASAQADAQAQIKASGPIKTKSDIIEELEKSRSKMTAEYKKLGKKLKKLEIKIKIAKLKKELESFEDSDEEILTCKSKPTGPKVRLPNLMSDYSDSESESAPEIDSDDE